MPRRALVLVLAVVACFLGTTQPAGAASAKAAAYAIGDSVMLGAKGQLERRGIRVDATVSRQFGEGVSTLGSLRRAGTLSRKVVIHLGTNGPISRSQFDALMRAVSGARIAVVLTMKEPRSWEGANNSIIRAGVRRWPNARLLDWNWWGDRNPQWFWGDGIHLRPEGAAEYARLIASKLR